MLQEYFLLQPPSSNLPSKNSSQLDFLLTVSNFWLSRSSSLKSKKVCYTFGSNSTVSIKSLDVENLFTKGVLELEQVVPMDKEEDYF